MENQGDVNRNPGQRSDQHSEEEQQKTIYKETTTDDDDVLSNGETSSQGGSGRSAFTNQPDRKNKPLGSGHEPGVTPGRDF